MIVTWDSLEFSRSEFSHYFSICGLIGCQPDLWLIIQIDLAGIVPVVNPLLGNPQGFLRNYEGESSFQRNLIFWFVAYYCHQPIVACVKEHILKYNFTCENRNKNILWAFGDAIWSMIITLVFSGFECQWCRMFAGWAITNNPKHDAIEDEGNFVQMTSTHFPIQNANSCLM